METFKAKYQCRHCDARTLGRYLDRELSPGEWQEIENHLTTCSHCRSVVEHLERLSQTFSQGIDQGTFGLSNSLSGESILARIKAEKQPFWADLADLMKAKRNILQLASIAAILLATVIYYQGDTVLPTGPSAIVNSVDGEIASVMILETQVSKHTIIWYTES
ncbi:MAG: zf-HC2 domain-containing protein [Desulfobacterium sp.]|nr:zf-HC2 domain-containing protein [Desulfobacterium sp.]